MLKIVHASLSVVLLTLLFVSQVHCATKEEAQKFLEEGRAALKQAKNPGDLGFAVGKLELALAAFEQLQVVGPDRSALVELGIAHRRLKEPKKAQKYLEKALELDRNRKKPIEEAYTRLTLGGVCMDLENFHDALNHYLKTEQLCKSNNIKNLDARVTHDLGAAYWRIGAQDKAAMHFEKALNTARNARDVSMEAFSLHSLGLASAELGDPGQAVKRFTEAIKLRRKLNDPEALTKSLVALGNSLRSMRDFDGARETELEITALKREREGPGAAFKFMMEIGNVYKTSGLYSIALARFGEAREFAATHIAAPTEELDVLIALAQVEQWRGNCRQAGVYSAIAKGLLDRVAETKKTGASLSLAGIARNCGRFDEAEQYYKTQYENLEKAGATKGMGAPQSNIGFTKILAGRWGEAIPILEHAVQLQQRQGDPPQSTQWLLCRAYMQKGEFTKAEAVLSSLDNSHLKGERALLQADFASGDFFFGMARQYAENRRILKDIVPAITGRGRAMEGQKLHKKALERFYEAMELLDDLRAITSPSNRRSSQSDEISVQGFLTAPKGIARCQAALRNNAESLKYADYSKALAFADRLAALSRVSRMGLDPEEAQRDAAAQERIAPTLAGHWSMGDKKTGVMIPASLVADERGKWAAYLAELRESRPLYADLRYPRAQDISECRLNRDELLIHYDVSPQGILVCVVEGPAVKKTLWRPIPEPELVEQAAKFTAPGLKLTGDSKSVEPMDDAAARRLSNLLLGEILSEIPPNRTVIIVPDKVTACVPFGALPTPEGHREHGEFFGDRNPIVYYHSIAALNAVRAHSPKPRKDSSLCVLADPILRAEDPRAHETPLPDNCAYPGDDPALGPILADCRRPARKCELLFTHADAEERSIISGAACNPGALTEGQAVKSGALLLCAPGYLGWTTPDTLAPTFFLTPCSEAPHGTLSLADVMDLKLRADLVCLPGAKIDGTLDADSGCVQGTALAFQYAGVRTVLLTLWPVPDEALYAVLREFLQRRFTSENKADALRSAKKALKGSPWDHPLVWGSFVLCGEPD